MKCATCGAPLEAGMERCPYCGSTTSYGETLLEEKVRQKQDEEKRRRLENLPRMKYVSGAFIPILYFCTFAWYAPLWYGLRLRALNALNPPDTMPAWGVALYNLLWIAVFFLPNSDGLLGLSQGQWQSYFDTALGVAIVLSVWLAFKARSILQGYAAKSMEAGVAVHTVAPSNVLLILFGPMYLQYQINKMISMDLLAPQI